VPVRERVWERTDELKANKGAPEEGRARPAAGEQNRQRERVDKRRERVRERGFGERGRSVSETESRRKGDLFPSQYNYIFF